MSWSWSRSWLPRLAASIKRAGDEFGIPVGRYTPMWDVQKRLKALSNLVPEHLIANLEDTAKQMLDSVSEVRKLQEKNKNPVPAA